MNARQLQALEHPLSTAEDPIESYRTIERQPDRSLLVVILAVDR